MASRRVKIPQAAGFVKEGFEHVRDVFRQSIDSGVERGGSFAAYYRGELVVNLWGGFADEESRRPWKHNTGSAFYSTTKSLAAVTMAHLVERGLIRYDQPVATFWPAFAANGKEKITLKDILSLKAGLPVLSNPFNLSLLRDDPEHLEQLLAQQKPFNTGSSAAYSPIVIALYLDQIVKKVDPQKRGLADYFKTEIAEPFGIDVSIGLPKSEFWRATRQTVVVQKDEYKKFQAQMMSNPAVDREILLTSLTQPTDFLRNSVMNHPDFVELACGSSHGVGSCAGMAKFHGILANQGLSGDGRQLLSQETIERLQTPLSVGAEKTFGIDFVYSYGLELLPVLEDGKLHFGMGHGGFGGQFAAADPKYRTGWAYCTNYLNPVIMVTGATKWAQLERALFECVHRLQGVKIPRRHITDTMEVKALLEKRPSKL